MFYDDVSVDLTSLARPPITTHNIVSPDKDPVLDSLNRCSLLNSPEDRVKVGGTFAEIEEVLVSSKCLFF